VSRTVGILGGMGPAATLDFVARLRRLTPARRDQDHLRLLIDDNPTVPNRNEALAGAGPSPAPVLAAMARGLQAAGAEVLVMPCNTAHAFQADIEAAVTIPFLSIVGETIAAARTAAPDLKRAGLLAVDGALSARLYQDAFAAAGVEPLTLAPEDQAAFMALVYQIKSGEVGSGSRLRMRALADRLAEAGADVVVAACTEVPLVLDAQDLALPLVNSTEALAVRTVAFARGG
jgi:aspartate racemase